MPSQFDPPSGTRDFLAADVERREHAFAVIKSVFASYGFEPLQTPAFERLDVLLGRYGDESEKLIFKILRRGEHEATGEADLALRYDMTVPLARVAAAYGSQLPMPYKRYAMGPVWRADRPGRDRYREFYQCDLDTLGSTSALADAEVLAAHHDALVALGLTDFTVQLNSRHVLAGLLAAFGIPPELGPGVLISLDKLDKAAPGEVVGELTAERGLQAEQAADLVATLTVRDAVEQVRVALTKTDEGITGLDEVDAVLSLLTSQIPAERIAFTPRLARGLSYYTGPIWELVATGVAGSLGGGGRYDHLIAQLGGPDVPGTGSSLGVERILTLLPGAVATPSARLDVAVTMLGSDLATQSFGFAAAGRLAGLRASVYLGSSAKLRTQLKWANDSGARWCVIYGPQEQQAGLATVRDMRTGHQAQVADGDLAGYLAAAARADG
jgi:histidyl-tRNA synthetase